MRIAVAILMLVSFGLSMFQNLTPYLEFAINQEFIAENLCENKDIPGSDCNGHCQLRKMLTEDDDSEPIEIRFRTDADYWVSVKDENQVPSISEIDKIGRFGFQSEFHNSTIHRIDPPPPKMS